ncbi:MAG: methyltransferase domain-containing protein, partial [Actinomycetia bacterium]|nr:methyltransferase domain-containing protein [Actinomycetes bacterium]
LPPGSDCLDVGSGRGTIAVWLAHSLPSGQVTAVDLDHEAFLDDRPPNLTLETGDIRQLPLPSAAFDLIHGRAILGFIPTRVDLLTEFFSAIKPGGAILLTEMDFGKIAAGPDKVWAAFWTSYLAFADAQDWDLRLGGKLPHMLAQAGFVDVDCRHIAPTLNIASQTASGAEARTWSLTLATLAPKLIGGGFMAESQLSAAIDVIRNPNAYTPGPGFGVVTARKPIAGADHSTQGSA